MTVQTKQWVRKAEGDWDVVLILRRSRKPSRFDHIRFHCQQCAEKYLKARLQEAGLRFPRTHNLVELLMMALPIEPGWDNMRTELRALNNAAVQVRYPGRWGDSADARRAFATCQRLRLSARKSLKLP